MHRSPNAPAPRWLALLTLGLAMTALCACSGAGKQVKKPESSPYPGHLAYIADDATFVVSVNRLDERLSAIETSNAWKAIQAMIASKSEGTELESMAGQTRETFDLLERVLDGRMTFALFDAPADGNHQPDDVEFVLIANAEVQEVLRSLNDLDEAPPPVFVDTGDGIMQQTGAEGPEELYMTQSGPIGMLSSNRALLVRTMELSRGPGKELLVKTAAYERLTADLRDDADVFVYLPDWRTSSDEWGELMGEGPDNSAPRGMAATVMLDEGVDVEMLVEFDDRDIQDPDVKALLPALRGGDEALALPSRLPPSTLGYFGFALKMDEVLSWLKESESIGQQMPAQEIGAVVEELLSSFDGEFGVAITGVSPEAPQSLNLGMPVPGAVFMGKIKDGASGDKVARIIQGIIELANLGAGPDGMLGGGEVESVEGSEVRVYSVVGDPGLTVAMAVVDDLFLIGTREGVTDVLSARAGGEAGLVSQSSHPLVAQSIGARSNYAGYVNLKALYGAVKGAYGPMLGMMTGGLVGGAKDDPVEVLVEIFQHAGASMVYREGVSTVRFYLTATDLP